jgi:predicted nucleotidyltransferase
VLIERRGKPIAALVPPEAVGVGGALAGARPRVDFRKLAELCERYRVKTLYLFGSVLSDAFDAKSDVDVMFEPEGAVPGYFEQMKMTDELESLFGRPVDLITRRAVELSTNPLRKESILRSARVVYGR